MARRDSWPSECIHTSAPECALHTPNFSIIHLFTTEREQNKQHKCKPKDILLGCTPLNDQCVNGFGKTVVLAWATYSNSHLSV